VSDNLTNLSAVEKVRFDNLKTKKMLTPDETKILDNLILVTAKPTTERTEIFAKIPDIEANLHELGIADNDAYTKVKTFGFCHTKPPGEKGLVFTEKKYLTFLQNLELKIAEAKKGNSGKVDNAKLNSLISETQTKATKAMSDPNFDKNPTSKLVINQAEFEDLFTQWTGQKYAQNLPDVLVNTNPNPDGTYNRFRKDSNSLRGGHSPDLPHFHLEVVTKGADGTYEPIFNNHILLID